MATRFYPDIVSAGVTPSSWLSGWNATSTNTRAMGRRAGNTGTTWATSGTGVSGQLKSIARFVSEPLAAQTISGTVKAQIRFSEAALTDNYTAAIGLKVITSAGADRGTLLAVTATDTATFEFATTLTNRSLRDASDNTSITLSSLAVSDGDRIVVEFGFKQASTSVGSCTISAEGSTLADLAEDDTTTAANCPWIELSHDVAFLDPYSVGTGTVPTDNGSNATTAISFTPGTHCPIARAGDLVVVLCQSRATTTWNVATSGGQAWTSETAVAVTANIFVRAFWCTFNGTWSADPSFSSTSGTCTSAAMHIFRGRTASDTWSRDVAQATTNHAAAATITRTGITTVADDVVALAAWFTADDNTWGTLTGSGWVYGFNTPLGNQARNTASTDQSMATAYYIAPTGGTATGNVSLTQLTLGNDAATSWIMGFADVTPAVATSFVFNPFQSVQHLLVR